MAITRSLSTEAATCVSGPLLLFVSAQGLIPCDIGEAHYETVDGRSTAAEVCAERILSQWVEHYTSQEKAMKCQRSWQN